MLDVLLQQWDGGRRREAGRVLQQQLGKVSQEGPSSGFGQGGGTGDPST